MKQEDKKLLLKDLCCRLPYGIKAQVKYPINTNGECIITTKEITSVNCGLDMVQAENIDIIVGYYIFEVKPYLFPLSSMTEEKWKEFDQLLELELKAINDEIDHTQATAFEIDFYNKHHLDWRGLIPKGLAIDATNKNIY